MNFRIAIREATGSKRMLVFAGIVVMFASVSFSLVLSTGKNLKNTLAQESQSLAGSDVLLSSSRVLIDTEIKELHNKFPLPGTEILYSEEFMTMLRFYTTDANGKGVVEEQRLVKIKTIEPGWPQRGSLALLNSEVQAQMHAEPLMILPEDFANEYLLRAGQKLELGNFTFRVGTFYKTLPGTPLLSSGMAPAVLVSRKFIEQTGLIQPGSRIKYLATFNSAAAIDEQRNFTKKEQPGLNDKRLSLKLAEDSAGFLKRFISRTEVFLTFLAIATLILALSGTSASLAVFLKNKKRHAAVMRALGMRSLDLFQVYAIVALIPGVLGGVAGIAVAAILSPVMGQLLSSFLENLPQGGFQLHIPSAVIAFLSILAGLLVFTLLPILRLVRHSPVSLLRSEAPITAGGFSFKSLTGIALPVIFMFALLIIISDSFKSALYMTLGLGINMLLLAIMIPALAKMSSRLAKYIRQPYFKLAVRNLSRLTVESRTILWAAGQGVFLMAAILILDAGLQKELKRYDQAGGPDVFTMDVQPSQKDKFVEVLTKNNVEDITLVPLITVRISKINDAPFYDSVKTGSAERSWEDQLRVREYFISYRSQLIEGENLTAGSFWSRDFRGNEASVDEEWAQTLGINLGDRLSLDVHGLPYEATVTSMRKVHWQSMRPNSFIILSPGKIENAPAQLLSSFRAGSNENRKSLRRELVKEIPNITFIDVAETSAMVARVSENLAAAFRYAALISLAAGLFLLGLTVSAERRNRERDSALLKVFGSDKKELRYYLLSSQAVMASTGILLGVLPSIILSAFFFVPLLGTAPVLPWSLWVLVLSGPLIGIVQGIRSANEISARSSITALNEL